MVPYLRSVRSVPFHDEDGSGPLDRIERKNQKPNPKPYLERKTSTGHWKESLARANHVARVATDERQTPSSERRGKERRKQAWRRKKMNSPVLEGLNRGERLDGRPQGEPSPSGMVSSTSYSNVTRAGSLVSFKEYKQMAHSNSLPALLEYETLELRVHPPNIKVDNYSDPSNTIITIDSANRCVDDKNGTAVDRLTPNAKVLRERHNADPTPHDASWRTSVYWVGTGQEPLSKWCKTSLSLAWWSKRPGSLPMAAGLSMCFM